MYTYYYIGTKNITNCLVITIIVYILYEITKYLL